MYKQYTEWSSAYAKNIIETNKSLQDRVFKLVKSGYTIGTRYTLKKSGHLSPTQIEYVKRTKEHRMIVGYRPLHHSREAICVIWRE
jgi:hypothetical protein